MSAPFSIRAATAGDAEAAAEMVVRSRSEIFGVRRELLGADITETAFPDVFEKKRTNIAALVRDNFDRAIVAEVDGRMAGLVCWRIQPDGAVGELAEVTVDPDFQGKGIGPAMCRRAMEVLRERGCRAARVVTGLDAGHAPARKMYEKLGFGANLPWVHYYRMLDDPGKESAGDR